MTACFQPVLHVWWRCCVACNVASSRNIGFCSITKILVFRYVFHIVLFLSEDIKGQTAVVQGPHVALLMFWMEEQREIKLVPEDKRSVVLESLAGVYRPTHAPCVTGPPNYIHSSCVCTHRVVMRRQEGCVCTLFILSSMYVQSVSISVSFTSI